MFRHIVRVYHCSNRRDTCICLPINGIGDSAFGLCDILSHLKFRTLTRLNHFNLTAYGLQSPCLRLTYAVTDASPRLGMECAGSALLQSHFQRLATRRIVAHHNSVQEVDGQCNQDVENTKKFLRWVSDDALKDIWDKHMKALEKRTPAMATR